MATLTDHPVGEPISFALSPEQELLRQEVRRFGEQRLRPGLAERDAQRELALDLVRELGAMGLLGCFVPERWGGAGLDQVSYVVAVEELARVDPAIAVTVSVSNSVCCWPILAFARDELKERALRELASGEALGGFGLTEPGSGSDVASLKTTARRDGEDWVLDGEKAWITNAGFARWYVVVARTLPEGGSRGLSAFAVPADAPGFAVGTPEHKLGLRSSRTAPIYFNGCRIPAGNLLGEEGQGFKIAMATLDHSRLGIAAQAVGIHQRSLELAVDYARDRRQFGAPLAEHQAIQMKIAQMATELAAARELTRAAAAIADAGGHDAGRFASQAKLYASEAANRACWESLQVHGGNGFSDEYEISKLYRDVRVTAIYEGTSEMQRLVIARRLLRG
ncbi:MAG TPA: acyl-CoA dehydrogenase family protein [Thermoanaerobaculia bacterium]|jgi:alkylation response protein AidB-like acyl-CoA dehydrogenase|nr:acyl-CoA dehydrogenase family protein [Thermoanaerobaculia bacterium]